MSSKPLPDIIFPKASYRRPNAKSAEVDFLSKLTFLYRSIDEASPNLVVQTRIWNVKDFWSY